jgi:hypothetical protein
MGFFTGSTDVEWEEPGYSLEARNYLTGLYQGGTPAIPTEQIAGMSEQEQQAMTILSQYLGSDSEARDLSIELATQAATGTTDITQIPEYAALLNEVLESGQVEANRLGRTLQMTGNAESTGGRDLLGQSVEETMQAALATLAPYAAQERNMQFNAISLLGQLAGEEEMSTLNKIGVGVSAGSLPRTLEQDQNSADYIQQMTSTMFPYTVLSKIAGMNLVDPEAIVTENPSTLSKISQVATVGAQVMGGFTGLGLLGGALGGGVSGSEFATGALQPGGYFGSTGGL